ncbi:MAG TPA: PAS domain S-box protein, partial [Herpetosiphonaceae bacterium]
MAPVRAHSDGFPGATAPDGASDLLHFLLDSMAEGVLLLDDGLRIAAANPAVCALLGYSRQELMGRALDALFPSAPPDAEALLTLSRQAGALLRGRRKDGSACEVQLALHCPPAGMAPGFVLLLRDVTQRAQRERRLLEQQQFLRQVINAIPNFIFVKNAAGSYILANESFARQYGLSADELIGRNDADVVANPDTVRRFLDEDHDVLAHGSEIFIPEHPIMVEGARRWIQSIKRPLRIGEQTRVLGVITDITARKLAEERLRESEAWHRSIIAALEEAVIVQDADMRIVDCNPGAERMIGLPAEHMLGLEMGRETWRSIREDGSPFPYDEQPAILTLRTGQPQTNVLMGIYRPDGTPRWISINTQPLLLPGQDQPSAVVSSFFDVTERRQADRDLQLQRDFALQVMTTMGQGLTVTDGSGRFTFVNPAYAAMLGASPEELIGVSPFDLVHPDDRAELEAAYGRRQGGETTSYQARLLRRDQQPVNVLITGVPRWIEGRIEGSIAVVTDLTEPKRLEAALAQARDQALEASQLKSQFVANMSHEIRTPMNGIIGIVDLLLAAPISDEQQELVGIIRDSAHALLTILDDILDFSKIEAGRLELERVSFPVAEVIEGAIDLLAARAREKRIELMALVAPELAGPLWGDPGRLRQVLINLVGNAVKFTQRGEVIVSAACEEQTADHTRLRFSVTDTGIGLSGTARERLFQAFVQADSSTTRLYGGTGLGLSIAQRLAGMMGGEIGV